MASCFRDNINFMEAIWNIKKTCSYVKAHKVNKNIIGCDLKEYFFLVYYKELFEFKYIILCS